MPDPIRVTQAVRRCPECEQAEEDAFQFRDWYSLDLGLGQGCDDCSDGYINVSVDEECPTCRGNRFVYRVRAIGMEGHPRERYGCPDCNGSGRRLHNWATGWYPGDEILWDTTTVRLENMSMSSDPDGFLLTWQPALVLSDPSHRPEPMRWKQ